MQDLAAESWNFIALRVGRRCGRLTSNNRRANCGLSSVCRVGDAVGYAHRSCVAPGKLLAGRWTQMFSFPMKRVVISRRTRRHCNASSGSAPAQRSPRHQTVGRPHVLRAASSRYISLGRRGLPCPQVASRPLAATIAARSAVFLQSLIACNPTPTVCVPLVTPPWRNIVSLFLFVSCQSLREHMHISGTTRPIFTNFVVPITYGRGWVAQSSTGGVAIYFRCYRCHHIRTKWTTEACRYRYSKWRHCVVVRRLKRPCCVVLVTLCRAPRRVHCARDVGGRACNAQLT